MESLSGVLKKFADLAMVSADNRQTEGLLSVTENARFHRNSGIDP